MRISKILTHTRPLTPHSERLTGAEKPKILRFQLWPSELGQVQGSMGAQKFFHLNVLRIPQNDFQREDFFVTQRPKLPQGLSL